MINNNLKQNLWQVYTTREKGKFYQCNHCDYKTKYKSDVKKHLWQVHDIGNGKMV